MASDEDFLRILKRTAYNLQYSFLYFRSEYNKGSTTIMLEVCIDNLESAANAIQGGADELEICSSLIEGGLTPSPGLVNEVIKLVNEVRNGQKSNLKCFHSEGQKIIQSPKVNVMIRCRGGSNFCYNELEMNTMLSDIDYFKTLRIDRFVFGALNDKNDIDEVNCAKVVARAHPLPVTFHRAYDLCRDPENNLKTVRKLGFTRVLTSGQRPSVDEDAANDLIKTLLSVHGEDIEIMPGAGINCNNANVYVKLGCKIIHSSCKVVKKLPTSRADLCMGSSDIFVTDRDIVKNMKRIINS